MEQNLVFEAFKFMILGMAIVFIFLTIMVYAIKLQAYLINKFFSQKECKVVTKNAHPKKENLANKKIVAAIAATIQHHKNLKG